MRRLPTIASQRASVDVEYLRLPLSESLMQDHASGRATCVPQQLQVRGIVEIERSRSVQFSSKSSLFTEVETSLAQADVCSGVNSAAHLKAANQIATGVGPLHQFAACPESERSSLGRQWSGTRLTLECENAAI
jgi:hypothetical protein